MINKPLIKVYCGILCDGIKYLEMLNPNFGFMKRKNIFSDKDVFDDFTDKVVEITDDPSDSDFLIIPHNYFSIKNRAEYIDNFIALSEKFSKKILIFAIGDSRESVDIPNSIVFRMSQYASQKRQNEVIIPAYATDLSYGNPIQYKNKNSTPTIGFCGWANTNGFFKYISFLIKNYLTLHGPYRQGLYFRKMAINIIRRSSIVKSNFIIRSSYGASDSTVEIEPDKSRQEYRDNIVSSDFTLAPKGDGNYSVRFYETLSLGRVPILIDTDCPLPLDHIIDYSRFTLKVSYRDLGHLDYIIHDFYSKLTNEQWLSMQREARRVFEQYLKIDVFLRNFLTKENLLNI